MDDLVIHLALIELLGIKLINNRCCTQNFTVFPKEEH